jgi:hypothetical protein
MTLSQSLIFYLSHGRLKKKRQGRGKWKRREEKQRGAACESGEERKEKKEELGDG